MRSRIYLLVWCIILGPVVAAQAQDDSSTSAEQFWQQRQQIQKQFVQQLRPLVQKCAQDGANDTARQLQRLLIARDPQRQYLFFPAENKVGQCPIDGLPADLQGRVEEVLAQQADRLFQFARKLAEDGQGCAAIQSLNEVLFFNPNHQATRHALGHRKIDVDGVPTWRVKSDRLRIKSATRLHGDFDWPAKSYLLASTNHFQIASRASEEQTKHLAIQLERWHDAWRQVFFSYFDRAPNIIRRMDGKSKPGARNRKYRVVFFANKSEYVKSLSRDVPGIEVSTGYYDDELKTSFFYASDDPAIEDTWRHELTHQLFQESRRSVTSPFEEQHLWLGEGIAMYFESLIDHGPYAVVGGFDARRLQFARLRRLKEQFRIPLRDLASASKSEFQSVGELAKAYSQSAGQTHFLMDSQFGARRESLIEFLSLSYQAKLRKKTFESMMGMTYEEIESAYDQFLRVSAETLSSLEAPESRTELCLVGAKLEDGSLDVLQRCENLIWLDLSACDVRGDRLKPLLACQQLRRLFLTGAKVDAGSCEVLAKLPIVELDLAGSTIDDAGLSTIAMGATQLRALNVSGSPVTRGEIKRLSTKRRDLEIRSDSN